MRKVILTLLFVGFSLSLMAQEDATFNPNGFTATPSGAEQQAGPTSHTPAK